MAFVSPLTLLKAAKAKTVGSLAVAFGMMICMGMAGFFLLRESPRINELGWLPRKWGLWLDTAFDFRTFLLAFLLGLVALAGSLIRRGSRHLLLGILLLALILGELAQIWIPRRTFSWLDLGYTLLGILAAELIAQILKSLVKIHASGLRAAGVHQNPTPVLPAPGRPGLQKMKILPSGVAMKTLTFLGIPFWNDSTEALLAEADRTGGLLVVPSAPSLGQMGSDSFLMRVHREADYAVVDGGYVALILRLFGRRVERISGLQLLEKTVVDPNGSVVAVGERRILWVVPNGEEEKRIREFVDRRQLSAQNQLFYQAPYYQEDRDFDDQVLQRCVVREKPDWVILCLGGGRQEKLGHHLRRSSLETGRWEELPGERPNGPLILCTGAAISFFTGGQAKIPKWADRLYLGWLFRICQSPRTFLPRYLKAFWHFPKLLWRERKGLFQTFE